MCDPASPQFSDIYEATGDGLVKKEAGYGAFNNLEVREFAPSNSEGKPMQPVATARELLALSVAARPVFDELMAEAVGEAKAGDNERRISPGGVTWELGPLKKVHRVIEKARTTCLHPPTPNACRMRPCAFFVPLLQPSLSIAQEPRSLGTRGFTYVACAAAQLCLDPSQRAALDAGEPAKLNASGVLDVVRRSATVAVATVRRKPTRHRRASQVRGMITCKSMAHAHLALDCLARRFGKSGTSRARARCVRSKNRYAAPSAGGWMGARDSAPLRSR